jgi:DNA polymerase V
MVALVDCNNFYCSCERIFRPELRIRPVVVLSNNDGCIISRSEEAKALGLAMGVPYFQYRDIIMKHRVAVFSSNYHLYGDMSKRVSGVLREIAPGAVEVYSVDESFVCLSGVDKQKLSAWAHCCKAKIEQCTGIPVSVGIGMSKVIAKIANRLAKKKSGYEGVCILDSQKIVNDMLPQVEVSELWGIGCRYAKKLQDTWCVKTAADLAAMPDAWIARHLGGVVGQRLVEELRGNPVLPMKSPLKYKKVIGTSRMFGQKIKEYHVLYRAVCACMVRAAEKLRRQHCVAGRVTVQLYFELPKHSPLPDRIPYVEKEARLDLSTAHTPDLLAVVVTLVAALYEEGVTYTKGGVVLSSLTPDDAVQPSLFFSGTLHNGYLMAAIDNINFSMGADTVYFGTLGKDRPWQMKQSKRSPRYTTRWNELCQLH